MLFDNLIMVSDQRQYISPKVTPTQQAPSVASIDFKFCCPNQISTFPDSFTKFSAVTEVGKENKPDLWGKPDIMRFDPYSETNRLNLNFQISLGGEKLLTKRTHFFTGKEQAFSTGSFNEIKKRIKPDWVSNYFADTTAFSPEEVRSFEVIYASVLFDNTIKKTKSRQADIHQLKKKTFRSYRGVGSSRDGFGGHRQELKIEKVQNYLVIREQAGSEDSSRVFNILSKFNSFDDILRFQSQDAHMILHLLPMPKPEKSSED